MADDQPRPRTRVASVMEDPSALAIARVYAVAMLDAAKSVGVEDLLEELASLIDDVLDAHPDFRDILFSVAISREQKLGAIDRVVGPFGSEMFTSFLKTLARHERLELLPLILSEGRRLFETRSGRKTVEVTSARPLEDSTIETIRQRLDDVFPFEPNLNTVTDPSLLGGLIIRVDNTVYDGSLRTRMRQLRSRLRERSLHEIQSGRDRFSHPTGD